MSKTIRSIYSMLYSMFIVSQIIVQVFNFYASLSQLLLRILHEDGPIYKRPSHLRKQNGLFYFHLNFYHAFIRVLLDPLLSASILANVGNSQELAVRKPYILKGAPALNDCRCRNCLSPQVINKDEHSKLEKQSSLLCLHFILYQFNSKTFTQVQFKQYVSKNNGYCRA